MKRLRSGYGIHKKEVRLENMLDGHAVARISLGKKKLTYISVADIDILKEHSFYAHKRSDGKYVARSSQSREYLHRILMKAPKGKGLEVDHVNSDPLDNTRGNLRVCNTVQNNLAKERETVGSYVGIKKVQKRSTNRWDGDLYKWNLEEIYEYKAMDKNGKVVGTYSTALEAASRKDGVLFEHYKDVPDGLPFHNYGFIRWNVLCPDEVGVMEDWLFDQRNTAQADGYHLMEDYGWS